MPQLRIIFRNFQRKTPRVLFGHGFIQRLQIGFIFSRIVWAKRLDC
jgi:hypothetical protein